jgi:hypothetical protein
MDHLLKILLIIAFFPAWLALNVPYPDIFLLDQREFDHTVFGNQIAVGPLENKKLKEASGMVFSRRHDGVIYGHNDSGSSPRLYIFDTLGRDLGTIRLKDVYSRDWEDIAVGPGPDSTKSYIYVGEIGDNRGQWKSIRIMRIAEPDTLGGEQHIQPEVLKLKYPDGARDAETLMVDPVSKMIYVITKRDSLSTLYQVPIDAFAQEETVLEKVMVLPFSMATGGDISADGTEILIRNYFSVYYWKRFEGESIPEALSRPPLLMPYKPELQGEAIAFQPNGKSYFTLSERRFRIKPILYRYDRK